MPGGRTRTVRRSSVLLGALLLAACSTAAPQGTSTTSKPTGASAPTGEASSADASSFVGRWFQHAGGLNISADGSVEMIYQVDRAPQPAEFPELKLRIESVTDDTATAVVLSSDDPLAPAGSKFTFRRTDPGILATTPQGDPRVWCDQKNKELGACGA